MVNLTNSINFDVTIITYEYHILSTVSTHAQATHLEGGREGRRLLLLLQVDFLVTWPQHTHTHTIIDTEKVYICIENN